MLTKQLKPGTIIGNPDSPRTVIISTLINEGGDGSYPVYIAVAHDPEAYHQYVVWYVADRPDGWLAESGEYFHDAKDAIINWQQKGGK